MSETLIIPSVIGCTLEIWHVPEEPDMPFSIDITEGDELVIAHLNRAQAERIWAKLGKWLGKDMAS